MEGYRRSLMERMKGAALLNIGVYEEVEHDPDATGQAAIVVGIVAVCAAIGGAREGAGGIIGLLLAAYIGWLLWAGVTYVVGDKLLGGTATWGELLRTTGFAQSPGVLLLLGFIPLLGWIVRFVVWIWLLLTVFIGVRQALDVGSGRALAAVVIGWFAYLLLGVVVGMVLVSPDFL